MSDRTAAADGQKTSSFWKGLGETFLYGKSMAPALGLLLAILVVFFSLATPYFFALANFKAIISNIPVIAIMAVGMTFVLLIGGLVGWLISMLVEATGLSGTDRFLGLGFGFGRGALLAGVLALAGGYLGFSQDQWWQESRLMPYAERIGNGIRVLAPRALEVIDGADHFFFGYLEKVTRRLVRIIDAVPDECPSTRRG